MRAASMSPLLLAAAVLVASGPRTAAAQSPPDGETGVLAGRVLSPSGAPLSGASVADLSSGHETRTGRSGRFRFERAARGFHLLLIAHPRHGTDTVRTPVAAGKTVSLELTFRGRGDLAKSTSLGDETAPPAAAGSRRGTARIVGRLVDRSSDRPVEAATLTLREREDRTYTDAEGRFSLDSLPGGTHELRVEHVGYGSRELVVQVPDGRTADVRIGLAPQAVPMPPIKVQTELRPPQLTRVGFYDRRRQGEKLGSGHFLVADEIVRRGGSLPQVLSTLPELRNSGRVRVNGEYVRGLLYFDRYDEGRFGTCLPAIFLDDHKIVGSGSPEKAKRAMGPNGVASLAAPSQVAGVEVYDSPASTVGRYQGSDSRCGVIAIWTRAG